MKETEIGKWRRLQRERDAHLPRAGTGTIVRDDADNPALLHPGNEGRDEERERAKLLSWTAVERPGGKSARALADLDRRTHAGEGEPSAFEVATIGPPETARTRTPGAHAGAHEKRIAGGEPRKHPRAPSAPNTSGGVRQGFDAPDAEHLARTAPRRTLRGPVGDRVFVPTLGTEPAGARPSTGAAADRPAPPARRKAKPAARRPDEGWTAPVEEAPEPPELVASLAGWDDES